MSCTIQWYKSFKFQYHKVITNLSSMSKTKVLIEDYSNLDSKGIFQSPFKSIRSNMESKNNINIIRWIRITQHPNQREYILIELATFNPNKKSLVTHCHGNLTRRKEEMEWNQAMMSHWFCVFLQSLCSLLLRFTLYFPLFSLFLQWPKLSSKDRYFLKWTNGLFYGPFCLNSPRG